MSSRKRKYRHTSPESLSSSAPQLHPDIAPHSMLFIQAYEADIIRGPNSEIAAKSLEVIDNSSIHSTELLVGEGLIRWGGSRITRPGGLAAVADSMSFDGQDGDDGWRDEDEAIWVDRYDARLLLDDLPPPTRTVHPSSPGSPSGWSDLPSDTEDTFFFSPDEAEDYRREKRRRIIDQNRQTRLKAMRDADPDGEPEEEIWGESDEEPDGPQRELMRRTATHISSSPNPAQLEMRILANHGGDKRFAFLRGRWARFWKLEKTRAKLETEATKKAQEDEKSGAGLVSLIDYGDSDSDDDEGPVGDEAQGLNVVLSAESNQIADVDVGPVCEAGDGGDVMLESDAAIKEARRARAKEWAKKRRALTSGKV